MLCLEWLFCENHLKVILYRGFTRRIYPRRIDRDSTKWTSLGIPLINHMFNTRPFISRIIYLRNVSKDRKIIKSNAFCVKLIKILDSNKIWIIYLTHCLIHWKYCQSIDYWLNWRKNVCSECWAVMGRKGMQRIGLLLKVLRVMGVMGWPVDSIESVMFSKHCKHLKVFSHWIWV